MNFKVDTVFECVLGSPEILSSSRARRMGRSDRGASLDRYRWHIGFPLAGGRSRRNFQLSMPGAGSRPCISPSK